MDASTFQSKATAVKNKDSREVAEFLNLFSQLQSWSDDDPAGLTELAARDDSVKDLCIRLSGLAIFLSGVERLRPVFFAAPVDPAFIAAWREFEERYEDAIQDVSVADLLSEILENDQFASGGEPPEEYPAKQERSNGDLKWDIADGMAGAAAHSIENVIDFAKAQIEQDPYFPDDLFDDVADGLHAWARFKRECKLDVRGIMRRRHLIPFVLVPRQVAAKYGDGDKVSMLTNLKAAHDAFVFGAPLAALAMMRSILEAALRDHYGAQGDDLNDYIQHARDRLPKRVTAASLHRLRKRANAVLHLAPRKVGDEMPNLDDVGLEKEIVSLLLVLRTLIEGAPSRTPSRA